VLQEQLVSLARTLQKLLLERGYRVRGTVRNPNRKEKTEHLNNLPNASSHLQLIAADLELEGSFDEAIKGCVAVFHTASPFFTTAKSDGYKELINPALNGTKNVFESIRRAGTVKKVILTSSMAAVGYNGGQLPPEHVYSEKDWSYVDYLTEKKIYYPLGKTLAEKAAWEFIENMPEAERPRLVVINPTLVVGPVLQPELNTSSEVIKDFITGKKNEIPQSTMGFVDVRDVALAHVLGLEVEEAAGRHLLIQQSLPWETICSILRKLFPEYPVPSKVAEGERPKPMLFDNSKAKKLGITFETYSIEDMLRDSVVSLKNVGLISSP